MTHLRKADLDGESALLSLGSHFGLCVVRFGGGVDGVERVSDRWHAPAFDVGS